MKMRPVIFVCALLLAFAPRARAYIDICPTLGRIILESSNIALIEVEKTHREKRIVIYKRVADLKGELLEGPIRHQLTDGHPPREPRHILDWAAPGQQAVLFGYRNTNLVCIGHCWYQAHRATTGVGGIDEDAVPASAALSQLAPWWRMSLDRPELALVYCGSPARLARHVKDILAGKRIIITTVAHGAQGRGSFSDCVFNDLQAGAFPPLQRLHASLNMPRTVYDIDPTNSPWFAGMGAIDESQISATLRVLNSETIQERIDALNDLASLGAAAKTALPEMRKLLSDADVAVRLSAATAVARIDPSDPQAISLIVTALSDPSPITRRTAAQCIARLGPPAKAGLTPLLKLVTAPDPDPHVRAAAVDAIGRLKPSDAGTVNELVKLLSDPSLRLVSAESLGRVGPAASPALPALAAALKDQDATWQWTAARAMVLIGGEGARAVVPFLIDRTEKAPRSRELYQLTWLLGLLGPLATDAIPALEEAQSRDNELAAMAVWAITPEQRFPWQIGYRADRPCDLWLFADYIDRMGDRATPAAAALATKILSGTAGSVPSWGYHLLTARPEAAKPILDKGVQDPRPQVRRRAQLALDYLKSGAGNP